MFQGAPLVGSGEGAVMAPAVTVGGEEREGGAGEGEAAKAAAGSEEPLLAEDELLQMLRTLEEAKEGQDAFFGLDALDEHEQLDAQLHEVLERQHSLQRRHDRLLRLVRRKQATNLGFHSGLQIYGLNLFL